MTCPHIPVNFDGILQIFKINNWLPLFAKLSLIKIWFQAALIQVTWATIYLRRKVETCFINTHKLIYGCNSICPMSYSCNSDEDCPYLVLVYKRYLGPGHFIICQLCICSAGGQHWSRKVVFPSIRKNHKSPNLDLGLVKINLLRDNINRLNQAGCYFWCNTKPLS